MRSNNAGSGWGGTVANALKHGGAGTEARVSFTWTRDGLQLLVDDDEPVGERLVGQHHPVAQDVASQVVTG